MIDKTPYTPGWKEVIRYAKAESGRLGHDYIGPEHYLLGIIRKGDGLAVQALLSLKVDLDDLKVEIEKNLEIGKGPTIGVFPENNSARRVKETARYIAQHLNHSWIGTEHMLLALLKEEQSLPARCLKDFGVDFQKSQHAIVNLIEGEEKDAGVKEKDSATKSKTPALDTFGRDLTQLAREGNLDPVIGREDEMERILQVLCRRTKNNPILLGEPGVGKTAIVEGLAQKIVNEDIPELLIGKRLLSLDLAAIIAGTKYRGQFEERLKAVMQEIRRSKDIIIFIDELHTLIGAGAAEGAIDASNMLKPALSRGELQCIGATTLEEYRKYVEKDGALERRFQTIIIDSPTSEETIQILKGLRSRYEQHHHVIISDEAIDTAVFLTDRYVTDRFQPDKAIDVIDEAGARARLLAHVKPPEIKDLDHRIAEYEEEIRELAHAQEFEKCQQIKQRKEEARLERDELLRIWHEKTASKEKRKVISSDDIAYIVSKWTGIPITRLEEEETQRLLRMEEEISRLVVSQKEAIAKIAQAIRRARAGLKDPKRPTGSFLFLGPTGVGKTELAKKLAEFLFGEEDALVRIDMSEYMEKFSVSRLLGAPPGYVGYEEGGQLTDKVRTRPYSVVLLDEIEKAHPDVFGILLQVFDEGQLTDSWGHTVDFRNTVVILTSNVGTKNICRSGGIGFQQQDMSIDYDSMKEKVLEEVKKTFNPEFINRVDEIVVFHALNEEDIKKIVDIMMEQVNERLKEKEIILHLSEDVKDYLVKEGYDLEYGARPLRRTIQKYIEDPFSVKLIEGAVPEKTHVDVVLEDGEIRFRSREKTEVLVD